MIIDFLCVIVGLYGFWVGYFCGIIKMVLMIIFFLFGFMVVVKFSFIVFMMLQDMIEVFGIIMLLVVFLFMFILILVLFWMLVNGLEGMLEVVNVNFINQIVGGGILMFFFVFLYSVLVFFVDNFCMIDFDIK